MSTTAPRPHPRRARAATTRASRAARRAFSMIEVLVALTIMGLVLTASLAALDSSFKSYKYTTEAASNHVVARIMMQRTLTMIRTGVEFGPYPDDVLDPAANPVVSTFLEFKTFDDPATDSSRIIRLERREATDPRNGPYELWYIQTDVVNGTVSSREERMMLPAVQELRFTLEYDVGPRLRRATVDLTLNPEQGSAQHISGDRQVPTLRMVSTAVPRRLD